TPVDTGLDMHRPRPDAVEVAQRVLGVVEFQVDPEMVMMEVKLIPIPIVAVLDTDDWLAEIRQTEQQTLLDLLELATLDLVGLILVVVLEAEEAVTAAEVRGEEGIDERHVVVDPAHLEDLLAAQAELLVPPAALLVVVAVLVLGAELPLVPALLDIAEELDAQLVGVEPARLCRHGSRVVVGVIDQFRRLERPGRHDGRVPVRGPALVH